MDFLDALQSWHWLSLGMLVLILEILGVGGFLLGIGVSAFVIAVLLLIFPDLPWYGQFIIFAFSAVILTLVYWKRFRKFNNKTEQPLLNSRMERLIGRRVSLITPLRDGTGKVQIEDALWTVVCDEDLEQGSIVDIVGAKGMALIVKAHHKLQPAAE